MTDRDPRSDPAFDALDDEAPTPSQSGGSAGGMAADMGARTDERLAFDDDASPLSLHKGDKPGGGASPNPPNREGGDGQTGSRADSRTARADKD